MYVCLCNGVTDTQIREAVAGGARTMRELRQLLGVCNNCGRCGQDARELLTETCARVSATAVHIELPSAVADAALWSAA